MMNDKIVSDAALVHRLETGDEQSFQEIYERYWHKLYATAVSKTGCRENAQELVQDIFMDLWHRRGQVQIDDLERYLFKAVKYGSLKMIRKEIVRRQYQEAVFETGQEPYPDTDNAVAFRELSHAISAGIEQLPDKVREIFRLNRIQHISVPEISERLQMPERTVEYHLSKALNLMRIYLKDYMISPAILALACSILKAVCNISIF
jgi:RNA polymerase sigma-70 factor (family 1)